MNSFKSEDLAPLLNLSFNDTYQEMRYFANSQEVPIIQDEGLAFLEMIIGVKRPLSILEIGTAIGYSASRMACVCHSHVTTIERESKMFEMAQENIKKLGLENQVRLIFSDALDAYHLVSDRKYDMIFIDAAKGQYQKFFELFEPLLEKNGIIVTDNMFFHGLVFEENEKESRNLRALIRKIKNYHSFLLNHPNYNTKVFNIGDGMSVSVKNET